MAIEAVLRELTLTTHRARINGDIYAYVTNLSLSTGKSRINGDVYATTALYGLETERASIHRNIHTTLKTFTVHTYPVNQDTSTLIENLYKLSPGTIIELFELDATVITDDSGAAGTIYRFHSGTNEFNVDVEWQGDTYSAFPIEADGFAVVTTGSLPKPKIKVANIDGIVGALNRDFNDLVEAKFSRKRTLVKYLDAINFPSGNPLADPNQYLPDDVFYINRKSSENRVYVEYELVAAIELEGVRLPRRQIIQNVCPWVYRGTACGYPRTATGSITFGIIPSALDTITINNTIFTFVAAGASGNEIDIAGSLILTLDNMISVLNDSVVVGVALATYTEDGESILTITYDTTEAAGNSFTLAASDATVSGNTLTGGTGDSYWDTNDNSVGSQALDVCGKRLSSCKLRFGEFEELPFGGFPGAGLF